MEQGRVFFFGLGLIAHALVTCCFKRFHQNFYSIVLNVCKLLSAYASASPTQSCFVFLVSFYCHGQGHGGSFIEIDLV